MTQGKVAGRRPGESGTRAAILAAARKQFSTMGYDRASIRGIGKEAGVDPALVTHFFGSKQSLFASVVELPFDPAVVIPRLVQGDRRQIGHRFATFLVGLLEQEQSRERVLGIVRAAASEPAAATIIRDLISSNLLQPMVEQIGTDRPDLRAGMIGTQMVGLAMTRHVVGIEPLATASAATLIAVLTPIFQHLLTEPLS